MNGIARQCNCLFSHAVKTDCYVYWICFFAMDQNEFPTRRFCILKIARYIYLTEFEQLVVQREIKITEFMFHNHIQTND